MKKATIVILFTFATFFTSAQVIPVETLFGDKRVAVAMGFNKPVAGKFSVMSLSSIAAYYDYKKGATEMVTVNSLAYRLHQNVAVSGGMQYHFMKGFMPNAALHFSHITPVWYLTLTPYYNFLPWNGLETSAVVEYKPAITEDLRLFTRFQGFYGHNIDANVWERGMLYFRLGLSHKKYSAGAAVNMDYYHAGGKKREVQNFGGFVRVDI